MEKLSAHKDQKFLDALLHNNGTLLDEIYQNHHQSVLRIVVNNSGQISDAKDLFQEVLINLFEMAKDGYVLTCPLGSFIQLIAKRKWLNKLKKKKLPISSNLLETKELMISDLETDALFKKEEEDQQRSLVQDKFKMLGPSCKEIIKLSWKQKEDGKYLKWNEIADHLDLSYAYVRKKASECKARLIELVHKDPKYKSLV